MATLVFSTIGTALGGPLGGAFGALVGNQFDRAIAGSPRREGPRLKELSVTTSSYGAPIARQFGRVRTSGTVIWATDLKESKEKAGGSKGAPAVTTYAYSASFAVALSSRPIKGIGRIWADGSLLRGEAGDLKAQGHLRIYRGHGDQEPDPLIMADMGERIPAFRGIALCVFEDLQLADFGNRIPALTFELFAYDDNTDVALADLSAGLAESGHSEQLIGLKGFSDEGGPLADSLATIDQAYPLRCVADTNRLRLTSTESWGSEARMLPPPAVSSQDDDPAVAGGALIRRAHDERLLPSGLRYYDLERDYQPGLQRAGGRASSQASRITDFPGALAACDARELCSAMQQRAAWSGDRMFWRVAELDPTLAPGDIVTVPDHAGRWRIETWEWGVSGVELDLKRLPPGRLHALASDPGNILRPRDIVATPTLLSAFELPWDGVGSPDQKRVHVAASSSGQGWTGAALYSIENEALRYLQPTGTQRSTVGILRNSLLPSRSLIFEPEATFELQLAADDLPLRSTTLEGLARGDNKALVGNEVIQFKDVQSLGMGHWRISGLLRGRGGTERAATSGCSSSTPFVLIDDTLMVLELEVNSVTQPLRFAAIGLADDTPAIATVINDGAGRKPLSPVQPRVSHLPDGSLELGWTRRARGAWSWPESGEVQLNEQDERYFVGVGDVDTPVIAWHTDKPELVIEPSSISALRSSHLSAQIWVRQQGSLSQSDPLLLWSLT